MLRPAKHMEMLLGILGIWLMIGSELRADLKYEETTKITGGMMQSMTKIVGFFGAKGLDNQSTTHYLKGDCKRTDHYMGSELTTTEIVCLDRDQIINIDHKKKTYTVITFEQLREQVAKAMQEAKQRRAQVSQTQPPPPPSDVKVQPKITVKDTGESKIINGFNAKRFLMSFQIEAQDEKTKNQSDLGMDGDVWMTKDISGWEEERAFNIKYAQKMASPELVEQMKTAMAGLQDPRMGQGLAAMQANVDKMDGVPVLSVLSMKMSGTVPPDSQQPPPKQDTQKSQSKDTQTTVPQLPTNLGKVLGGLGGFGHKKKKEETQTQTQENSPVETSTTPSGTTTATANLMQMTTELKSLSRAGLDTMLFEIPRGYKQKLAKEE